VNLLIRQRTALKNKLHSVSQKPGNFSIVTKAITKQVQQLDRQVASLESSMEQLIRSHQGELFVACEKNKACRELFSRLVEKGKSKKLALIAVANKLIKQALCAGKYHSSFF